MRFEETDLTQLEQRLLLSLYDERSSVHPQVAFVPLLIGAVREAEALARSNLDGWSKRESELYRLRDEHQALKQRADMLAETVQNFLESGTSVAPEDVSRLRTLHQGLDTYRAVAGEAEK